METTFDTRPQRKHEGIRICLNGYRKDEHYLLAAGRYDPEASLAFSFPANKGLTDLRLFLEAAAKMIDESIAAGSENVSALLNFGGFYNERGDHGNL